MHQYTKRSKLSKSYWFYLKLFFTIFFFCLDHKKIKSIFTQSVSSNSNKKNDASILRRFQLLHDSKYSKKKTMTCL